MRSSDGPTRRMTGSVLALAGLFISMTLSIPDSVPARLKTLTSGIMPTAEAAAALNGKIAFVRVASGDFQIFVMNADGTNPVQLTSSAGNLAPSFSLDGSKIAFVSRRDGGNDEIYVMNADGTNQTRLTNNTGRDSDPSFSPDGTKIAFWSTRDGNGEIYVMNADGANQTRLTNNTTNDAFPGWSPDGTKIVFESGRDGNEEIYVMNADGTNQTRLTNNSVSDGEPCFSPDGTKVVFERAATTSIQIVVMNADGTNPVQLTSSASSNLSPVFSPDGKKIAFQSSRDGNDEIYVMNSDGSNQTRVTNNTVLDQNPGWQPIPRPDTIGVFRPSTNQFLLRKSNTSGPPDITINFGQTGDIPITGDWDGDGVDDVGVFRPSTHQFLLRVTNTFRPCFGCPPITVASTLMINFGQTGDKPVVGDWNGDGIDTPGVFRSGEFLLTDSPNINNSSPAVNHIVFFGTARDTPLAGDWNGDGVDTIGVQSGCNFNLRNSLTSGPADISVCFGLPDSPPVVGDWDGDGIATPGVLHQIPDDSRVVFLITNSLTPSGFTVIEFGLFGDIPLSGIWSKQPPNGGVNDPNDGSSRVGQEQTFVTTCSDPDGWHDISTIDFRVAKSNPNGDGNGVPLALWVQFDENRNVIRFYDPDLQTWQEGVPGVDAVLASRFADLFLAQTSVQGSGPQGPSARITWSLVFKQPAIMNNYKQYLQITDDSGLSTGFDQVGSWSVTQ